MSGIAGGDSWDDGGAGVLRPGVGVRKLPPSRLRLDDAEGGSKRESSGVSGGVSGGKAGASGTGEGKGGTRTTGGGDAEGRAEGISPPEDGGSTGGEDAEGEGVAGGISGVWAGGA